MRLRSGYELKKARIEMLPLIDIVFLLLVFFVYAMLSMVVHRGLRVQLPAAAAAQVDRRDSLSITVTDTNEVLVDQELVPLDRLVARVVRRRGDRQDMAVFVRGDRRADLGVAIRVLDLLRGAGIDEVSFECAEPSR